MNDDYLLDWMKKNPGKTYWDCVAEVEANRQANKQFMEMLSNIFGFANLPDRSC